MSMHAGLKGYRDIANFSDDDQMLSDYFGIIARGNRYYLSRYININDGKHVKIEISKATADEIIADYNVHGWRIWFIDRWIMQMIV